ncbi:MAG: hypothetical protein PHF64_00325 [Methanoregula sp.]|nr:hypothetical protein [Methanoregula sp.]
MKNIEGFKIGNVPHHAILVAATSAPDYEMDRVLIADNWPDYGDYTVIRGSHCSCYDFDDTEWDAMVYSEDELVALLNSWEKSGYGAEKEIVKPALVAIGKA